MRIAVAVGRSAPSGARSRGRVAHHLAALCCASALLIGPRADAQGGVHDIPETIAPASSIEGLHALLSGLDLNEFASAGAMTWGGTYTVTGAALSVAGTFNGSPLLLSYLGALSGTFGSTDLVWSGTWTGSLGATPVMASDVSTWTLQPGTGSYAAMDFLQSGQAGVSASPGTALNPQGIRTFLRWIVRGAELFAEYRLPSGATYIEAASAVVDGVIGEDPPVVPPPRPPATDTLPVRPTDPRRDDERFRLTWQQRGRGTGDKTDLSARYDIRLHTSRTQEP